MLYYKNEFRINVYISFYNIFIKYLKQKIIRTEKTGFSTFSKQKR